MYWESTGFGSFRRLPSSPCGPTLGSQGSHTQFPTKKSSGSTCRSTSTGSDRLKHKYPRGGPVGKFLPSSTQPRPPPQTPVRIIPLSRVERRGLRSGVGRGVGTSDLRPCQKLSPDSHPRVRPFVPTRTSLSYPKTRAPGTRGTRSLDTEGSERRDKWTGGVGIPQT